MPLKGDKHKTKTQLYFRVYSPYDNNKPKTIIYLCKTIEPIRVLYSDNVTIVKHKYKP